jgi:hypothetical protein
MKRKAWVIIIVVLLVILVAYTQLTIFVLQPIGAVPEGRTLIMLRGSGTKFIDSADAMCERTMGSVNLICRAAALAATATKGTILLRLPYSETLYLISTGGHTFER